jgi:RNA polymerase sigma-70 factor (ECF subfamily)
MNEPSAISVDPAASIVEDAALVHAIVQGEMQALETLFNKYQASVYQTAYGVTRDAQVAEEVLQDVFFRLYRFADRINGALPLAPWLYRVTINLCYNRFKGLRMWTDSFHELAERLFAPPHESPERAAEQHELQALLQAALGELEPKQRAVLVLRYLHEYNIGEIAEIMGLPEGTVKSRLFHARKVLRQRLEYRYGTPDLLLPDPVSSSF